MLNMLAIFVHQYCQHNIKNLIWEVLFPFFLTLNAEFKLYFILFYQKFINTNLTKMIWVQKQVSPYLCQTGA